MAGWSKQQIKKFIEDEPEFHGSIWKQLGWRKALWATILMLLMPYRAQRMAVRATKLAMINRLKRS